MAEGEVTTFTALTERFNLPLDNYKKPKLLYCSNGGHFLRILPDGTVDGTRDKSDQHSKHPSLGGLHLSGTWRVGEGRISKYGYPLLQGPIEARHSRRRGCNCGWGLGVERRVVSPQPT